MSERGGAVHVVTTRRTYKGRVYETHLLRRSYRDGDRVKNETLGNLSHLPAPVIELVRRALRGETFVPVAERLEVLGSRPHGHVQAVRVAMQRLGIESLIGTRPSSERERILALIAAREGINEVFAQFPDTQIYVCAIDPELNDKKYIVPGLGDAGDRIFNTRSVE